MTTRTSGFALAAIAAIATVALAPGNASAHSAGGNFGGGYSASVGSAAGVRGGYVSSPYGYSNVSHYFQATSSIPRLVAGHTHIRTKSAIPRVAGTGNAGGHKNIPTQSAIPSLIAGHSNIPTKSVIPQLVGTGSTGPTAPLPPKPVRAPLVGTVDLDTVDSDVSCLTKRYLPDGSILFEDLCKNEAAITPAAATATEER
jgi:hypothetical protein